MKHVDCNTNYFLDTFILVGMYTGSEIHKALFSI